MTKAERELIKALTEAVQALTAVVARLQPQVITVYPEKTTTPQPWTTPQPNTTPWNPPYISPTIICGTNKVPNGLTVWNASNIDSPNEGGAEVIS